MSNLDDFWKTAIWTWLVNGQEQIVVAVNGSPIDRPELQPLSELVSKHGADAVRVFAMEEVQWLKLTGKTKTDSDNSIGQYPFDLLCAVSRARENGLTNVEAAKQTGQDPRSLHGRVQLLVQLGLVIKEPVVRNSIRTSLVTCTKFLNRDTSKDTDQLGSIGTKANMDDRAALRRAIVSSVKGGHEGLRGRDDLKKELGYAESKTAQSTFNACLRSLEAGGYVARVELSVKDNPQMKLRCIKYLRDLPEDQDNEVDSDDDDEEDVQSDTEVLSGGPNGDSLVDSKGKGPSSSANNTIDTESALASQLNAGGLAHFNTSIRESSVSQPLSHTFTLFNAIYPVENQLYDVIHTTGTTGISAMELCTQVLSKSYVKVFARIIEFLTDSKDKKSKGRPTLDYLTIVKGIDFSARMKFYRYFSQISYCHYSKVAPSDQWGELIQEFPKKMLWSPGKLRALDNKTKSLPGIAEIHELDDGTLVPIFHGAKGKHLGRPALVKTSISASPAQPGRKRGRPRKNSADLKHPRVKPKKKPSSDRELKKAKLDDNADTSLNISQDQSNQELPDTASYDQQDTSSRDGAPLEEDPLLSLDVDVAQALDPQIVGGSNTGVTETDDTVNGESMGPASSTTTQNQNEQALTVLESSPSPAVTHISPVKSQARAKPQMSFAQGKREALLMDILERNDRVVEGGPHFLKLCNEATGEIRPDMDRKTFDKTINSLLAQGKIDRISVTVPGSGSQNLDVTRHMILSKVNRPSSEKIAQVKNNMIEGVKSVNLAGSITSTRLNRVELDQLDDWAIISPMARDRQLAKEAKKQLKAPRVKAEPGVDHPGRQRKERAGKQVVGKIKKEHAEKPPKRIRRVRRSKTASDISMETEKRGDNDIDTLVDKGGRRKDRTPFTVDADNFYRVIIIVRSLYGRNVIDWPQVVRQFPELSIRRAKAYWTRLRTRSGGEKKVNLALDRWESIFEQGYMAGDLPIVQSEDDYNIPLYLEYWNKVDSEGLVLATNLSLPQPEDEEDEEHERFDSIEDITNEYDIICFDEKLSNSTMLEPFWHQASMVKKEELFVNTPLGIYHDSSEEITPNIDARKNTKIAIKSIIATEDKNYSPEAAKAMLDGFGEDLVESSVADLERERVIIYVPRDKEKSMPGRNFAFSDKFNGELSVKLGPNVLKEVQSFETILLNALQKSKSGLIMSRNASDFSLISILEMAAYNSMDLKRSNMVASGSLIKGYVSRGIDRDVLDCDVIFTGRPGVDYGALAALSRPDIPVPGTSTQGDSLPKYGWIGIDGQPTPLWSRIVIRLLMHLALRGNLTKNGIQAKLKAVLQPGELDAVLIWLCSKGFIESSDFGYVARPHWYIQ